MNIWLINQYAVPPKYEARVRTHKMAKYLQEAGHNVTIITMSTIHNTDINLLANSKKAILKKRYGDLKFIHIKASNYTGSGKARVINHMQFCLRFLLNCKKLTIHPDVIICNTGIPFTIFPYLASKILKAKFIFEVRDLWPEAFVSYNILKPNSISTKILYSIEKFMYIQSDKIIFTMEGGKDYIRKKNCNKLHVKPSINLNKVHNINNGVDVDEFEYNSKKYTLEDNDLNDKTIFKVVYTGSIRPIYDLNVILETAKLFKNSNIKFLIWGDGEDKPNLQQRCLKEGIDNVIFKGYVNKKFIPFILSKADVNFSHAKHVEGLMQYGMSTNKMFEYIAAKKPILSDLKINYDLISRYNLGVISEDQTPESIKKALYTLRNLTEEEKELMTINFDKALQEYDFKNLSKKVLKIIDTL